MDELPETWQPEPNSDGNGWYHPEKDITIGIFETDDGEWILRSDNHVIGEEATEEEIREYAYEWMWDHQQPVNI